jgi:hypothetical protein
MNASKISKSFQNLFSSALLSRFNKAANFIRRTNKLTPAVFLRLLCLELSGHSTTSLRDMCNILYSKYGIEMTKEGLNSRFSESACRYLKGIFEFLLNNKFCKVSPKLKKNLNRLLISDCTSYQLHPSLVDDFAGCGGSGSAAGLKIYNQNDWLSGSFTQLSIGTGKKNDTQFTDYDTLETGDLLLQDLGFNNKKALRTINDQGAYYVSRLKSNTNIYVDGKLISLYSFLKKHGYTKVGICQSFTIRLSAADSPIRLVVTRVPQAVYEKRRRQQVQANKRKGREATAAAKFLLNFTVHITNTSEEAIDSSEIASIYSIRWQIENGYKEWKSLTHLMIKTKVKSSRLRCHTWAKLIALFLKYQLIGAARLLKWKKTQKAISSYKCIKDLVSFLPQLSVALSTSFAAVQRLIKRIKKILLSKSNELEKRKGNKYNPDLAYACSPLEILARNRLF